MARAKKQPSNRKHKASGGINSIRFKLITIILALSIIPLAIMTFFMTRSIKNNVLELETEIASQRMANAQKEIMSLIDGTFNGIDVLAKNNLFDAMLLDPSEENVAIARDALVTAMEVFPQGSTMEFVFGTDGKQLIRGDENDLGDVSEREYAIKALEGTKYLSDVIISSVSGQPTIFMSDPILDSDDKVLGGIAKSSNLDDLSEAIASITNSDTDITVVTHNLDEVAHRFRKKPVNNLALICFCDYRTDQNFSQFLRFLQQFTSLLHLL